MGRADVERWERRELDAMAVDLDGYGPVRLLACGRDLAHAVGRDGRRELDDAKAGWGAVRVGKEKWGSREDG